MRVYVDNDGNVIPPVDAAQKNVIPKMFSNAVLLAFGAFTMSVALTKYQVSLAFWRKR